MGILHGNFAKANPAVRVKELATPTMIRRGYPLPDLDSLRDAVCSHCDGAGKIPYEVVLDRWDPGHVDLVACEPGCDGGGNLHEHEYGTCYRCHGLGLS